METETRCGKTSFLNHTRKERENSPERYARSPRRLAEEEDDDDGGIVDDGDDDDYDDDAVPASVFVVFVLLLVGEHRPFFDFQFDARGGISASGEKERRRSFFILER